VLFINLRRPSFTVMASKVFLASILSDSSTIVNIFSTHSEKKLSNAAILLKSRLCCILSICTTMDTYASLESAKRAEAAVCSSIEVRS